MNEEGAELLDSELLKDADAEATAQRPALESAADELKTVTRLPAVTPPLPPLPTSFHPAPAGVLATQPLPVAFPPQSRVPTMPPAPPKPSWVNSLLTSAFPPAQASSDPARTRHSAGLACLAGAAVFTLVAIGMAFRGVPDDAWQMPVVAAALILAHALVAVGSGAFAFGLLRMGERLLVRGQASE